MYVWLVPLVFACAFALFNPYVGLVGATFGVASLVICLAFDVNVRARAGVAVTRSGMLDGELRGFVGRNAHRLATCWKVAVVALCAATAVASVGTWMVAVMLGRTMAPFVVDVFTGRLASGALLLALVICLVATAVATFVRCRRLLSTAEMGLGSVDTVS